MAKFSRSDIRDILKEAGATDDNIETAVTKLVRLHLDVVDPLKSENDTISQRVKEVEKLKSQLEAAETELEALKKEDYKSKLDAVTAAKEKVEKEYTEYKNEQMAKATKAAKEKAIRDYFKSKGEISDSNLDIAMRGMRDEIAAAELSDKNEIKDKKPFDALISQTYANLYKQTTTTSAETPNPPAGTGGKAIKSKEEIFKIKDAGERQAAIRDAILGNSPEFTVKG